MKLLKFKEGVVELTKDEAFIKIEAFIRKMIKGFIATYEYDDLYQVGCVAFLKAYNTYDISRNLMFTTYLGKLIFNELCMYHRQNKKHINNFSIHEHLSEDEKCELIDALYDENNYEEIAINNILSKNIDDLIKKLPSRTQTVINLRFYKNMSQTEIAKVIGKSQVTSSRELSRALKELKKKIC